MSDVFNAYCTLTEFRNYITPPGQTINEDSSDDEVIKDLITVASRRVDDLIGRYFYPRIETHHFDIPDDNVLWMDSDLLAVTTFTNGDDTVIAAADYIFKPANAYPKYAIQLKGISEVIWQTDTSSSGEQVIDVLGTWGYHEEYATRAWRLAGTISLALTDAILTIQLTPGHTMFDVRGGQIIKIDNEIMNTESLTGNVLTVDLRGDNGSTAATHLILAPVYIWQPMKDIKSLTLEIGKIMYRSRYGENVDVVSTYTPAGVIVTPRSLPVWAQEIIRKYQRIV